MLKVATEEDSTKWWVKFEGIRALFETVEEFLDKEDRENLLNSGLYFHWPDHWRAFAEAAAEEGAAAEADTARQPTQVPAPAPIQPSPQLSWQSPASRQ